MLKTLVFYEASIKYIFSLSTFLQLIDGRDLPTVANRALDWLLAEGPVIIFTLIASLIIYRLVSLTIKHTIELISKDTVLSAEQAKQRAKTLGSVLDALAKFTIFFIAILVILQNIGVQVAALIAGAGVLGVAVGFGAQSLVRDFISGFFILFENQFAVGDIVQIGSSKGAVEDLNLRTTLIRDFEGKLHTIPNGDIRLVINQSRGWIKSTIEFGVPLSEDPDKIKGVLQDEVGRIAQAPNLKGNLLNEPEVSGIEDFWSNAMIFKITITVKPGFQDNAAERIRTSVKKRFAEDGIELVGRA